MTDDEERIQARYEKNSDMFWDRKARLTYYLVSLSFGLFGLSIASFPYETVNSGLLVAAEIMAWAFLVLAGGCGLRANWGEAEQFRMTSIMAQFKLGRVRGEYPEGLESKRAFFDAAKRNSEKLTAAEGAETQGMRWFYWLLGLGVGALVVSRSLLLLC